MLELGFWCFRWRFGSNALILTAVILACFFQRS
jgi:hypothetical protein